MNIRLKSIIASTVLCISLSMMSACGEPEDTTPNQTGGGPAPVFTPVPGNPTLPIPPGVIARIDSTQNNTLYFYNLIGQPLPGYNPMPFFRSVKASRERIAALGRDGSLHLYDLTGASLFTILGNISTYEVANSTIAYRDRAHGWRFQDMDGDPVEIEGLTREDRQRIEAVQVSDGALVYRIGNTLHIRRPNGQRFPTLERINSIRIGIRNEGGSSFQLTDGLLAFLKNHEPVDVQNAADPLLSLNVLNLSMLSQGTVHEPPSHGFLTQLPRYTLSNVDNTAHPGSPAINYQISNSLISLRTSDGTLLFNSDGAEITNDFTIQANNPDATYLATHGVLIEQIMQSFPLNFSLRTFDLATHIEHQHLNLHAILSSASLLRAHNLPASSSHVVVNQLLRSSTLLYDIITETKGMTSASLNIALVKRVTLRNAVASSNEEVLVYQLSTGTILHTFTNTHEDDWNVISQ